VETFSATVYITIQHLTYLSTNNYPVFNQQVDFNVVCECADAVCRVDVHSLLAVV